MKILLTAFLPFQEDTINVSAELLNLFQEKYKSHSLDKMVLDVVYEASGQRILEYIKTENPDLILSFGQAKGRSKVSLEAIALNVRNAAIMDNHHNIYKHEKIGQGLLAYETKINVKKLSEQLSEDMFTVSYHAGTYVCNDVYYMTLDYIAKHNLKTICGFIHLPCLKEQVLEDPFMELDKIYETVTSIMDVILEDFDGKISRD